MHSISPWLVGKFKLNSKQYLQIEAHIPLLAYASRPDYAIVDNEEIQYDGGDSAFLYEKGAFVSLDTLQSIHFSLTYHQKITHSINWTIRYGVDYLRYTQPSSHTLLKNVLDIGISLSF